jgi:hypothetical protein
VIDVDLSPFLSEPDLDTLLLQFFEELGLHVRDQDKCKITRHSPPSEPQMEPNGCCGHNKNQRSLPKIELIPTTILAIPPPLN